MPPDDVPPFDESKATFDGHDYFPRFPAHAPLVPLRKSPVDPKRTLVVIERGDEQRAFVLTDIIYHHAAQGMLGGEPYFVAMCAICNTCIGLTPVVDGKVRQFSVGGHYLGSALFIDDDTGSYWDHQTGWCLHGRWRGKRLDTWPVRLGTRSEVLADHPDIEVALAPRSWRNRVLNLFAWVAMRRERGFLPPGFRGSMTEHDPRLPEMTAGLGVRIDGKARFYPTTVLRGRIVTDELAGSKLRLSIGDTGFPEAVDDQGRRPFQLLARWYTFTAGNPACSIYGRD